ncbi:MAG: sodium-translocating pyrophosphatase [Armatimonadetes bacterium]|nr:sodium-translocating pyrophosphatase [Armatimonadota bacterium]
MHRMCLVDARVARLIAACGAISILMILLPGTAFASEAIELPDFQELDIMWPAIGIVFICALIGLVFGGMWFRAIMREDPGSRGMQAVSAAVQEGAWAYLKRQMKTMIWFVIVIAIGLVFLYKPLPEFGELDIRFHAIPVYAGVAIAFVLGVAASYLAGLVGMMMAVRANVRVANAALSSFRKALYVAFRAGGVSGMATVGLGLLGACIVFYFFGAQSMKVLIGFGFGGCLAALFMRIGGGIYTKAADVGADLVGKIEKNIPEDDPRNAATIADNVGDNVGDCAGMAADVFESYEVTLVAAIILGAAASVAVGGGAAVLALVVYPLLMRAVGVIASIIGVYSVRGRDDIDMDPMQPINVGFWVSALFGIIGFYVVSYYVFAVKVPIKDFEWWRFASANLVGILLALVIGKLTEYFTSVEYKPVKETAKAAKTGPATVILSGFASGLESSVWGIVSICLTILAAMLLFKGDPALAAYGIALSGLGLLSTTGFMLAMDTYGPISDNANGIFEMSGALKDAGEDSNAHRIVAKLDAVGNTTKALTKGLAIATAVIAATALFRSFMADARLLPPDATQIAAMSKTEVAEALATSGLHIEWTEAFIGLLIGGAVPFLFCSFAINAVSRAAFQLVEEVRRQFREIVGIMDYDPRSGSDKGKPDYQRCVAISTAAAQKELLSPAVLAVSAPILVGFGLGYSSPYKGAAALGGFLAGAILSGQLMAVFLSNTGGLWDNAKKSIEAGLFGGKGTDEHKAGVVGDTVGDPFKDTAGPALNPLIKVMNLVAILVAPIAIQPISAAARTAIVVVAILALAGATLWSKRGGLEGETGGSSDSASEAPEDKQAVAV